MRHLTDKLLNKLEENEPELATSQEDECVICVNAKATMQTSPCGHRVVCRRCFVKTIQMAVSQRLLPLRCVICRAKILRLRHSGQTTRLTTSKSWQVSSSGGARVPGSVSCYSVGARSVPASASLYSVTSGESSLSGVSSVSSASGASVCAGKLCAGARCGGSCLGAVPRAPPAAPTQPRQPSSSALRRSQHHSMKMRLQEYQTVTGAAGAGRLPPIREFQREFREGRREGRREGQAPLPAAAPASAPSPPPAVNTPVSVSTRIRCAQKILTQLEASPQKKSQNFFRMPLRVLNKEEPKPRDEAKEVLAKNTKTKCKKDDKKKKKEEEQNKKQEDKRRDESTENKKNETAERKKEEKLKLKAEKEAKNLAKKEAKEEERQAKLLVKVEKRRAKEAKKEAKLTAQAEKNK